MFGQSLARAWRKLLFLGAACAAATPAPANSIILQYYESKWETIEKKMPDVFMAGYTHFWLPPPNKADTGGFSVGYDVFDRFNLGTAFDKTLYGTEQSLKQAVDMAHRAGRFVYIDYIPNHNGFRDQSTPGFVAAGDYPGFVVTLPGDVDGDFHSSFAGGELEYRLAGLIDIAQEKNHQFIRQPIVDGPQNIPNESPKAENARFYPDQSLPANFLGIHPFNKNNPLAGDPTVENATGLLLRNAQWLVEVIGADGLRIDAVKHVPAWFFSSFYDNVLFERGRPDLNGNPTTPFSFGEAFDGNFATLNQYVRKDGFGNRDVKDFPLFFAMQDVFNAGGFGNISNLEFASYDASDGDANDGSRGVTFVQSHDNGPPALGNVAHAYILTRPGFPIVYFNAKEFGNGRPFPQDGRGDALGGDFGNVLTQLVSVSRRYAKGAYSTRAADADVFVYERINSLIVGLNDRGDDGFDSRVIQTGFSNIILTELSGTAADPIVNADGDIPTTISVPVNGQVTIRVPRNRTNTTTHNRGYVMYGLAPPEHTLTVAPVAQVLPAESNAIPNGIRRLTPLEVITGTTFSISVQTTGNVSEDNALVKLDGGVDIDTTAGVLIKTGEFAGFEEFVSRSPRSQSGTGAYSLTTSTTNLAEGPHFIETVAFHPRLVNEPAAYSAQRKVIYIDRLPPPAALNFPTNTGTSDVLAKSYQVVASCPDFTADSMHIFFDQLDGYDFLGNVSGANKMQRTDRNEFRFDWNDITAGIHKITLVAFEPTGNSSVTHFNNIAAAVPEPDLFLGVDTDVSNSNVNFQPVPGVINTRTYTNEFVVRVDTSGTLSFPADFEVELEVDGVVYEAQPYNAGLLPPVNRLVQDDQNVVDQFDEFRFLWEGYGLGFHTMTARARLTSGDSPQNSVNALIEVPDGTPGPLLTLQQPTAGTNFDQPTSLTVRVVGDATVRSLQAFIEINGQQTLLAAQNNPPTLTPVNLSTTVSSYVVSDSIGGLQLTDGVYPIRAVAATGLNGSGISSEASTTISISSYPPPPAPPAGPVIDGNLSEFFNLPPLAVSAADGGTGGANPADFGSDGSLTEFHGRVSGGNLYLAVRGDMFNGGDPNNNATIIYIDTNGTQSTGAVNMGSALPPSLSDTGSALRNLVTNSSFYMSPALAASGAGFDAAVVITGTSPLSYAMYGFGTGGVPGSPSSFATLSGNFAFGTGLGVHPGAAGTTINGPTGFEVEIALAALGNPNPRNMRFAVVTTSDTSFPSPNTLPENSSNAFTTSQTIESLAKFFDAPTVRLNEVFNGATDWVEVVNLTTSTQNLGNWFFQWADGAGVQATLPLTGFSVPAGAYLLIHDDNLTPQPPVGSLLVGSNIPWSPERAGSAALIDAYGVAVDYVRWESTTFQQFANDAPPGTGFTGWPAGFDSTLVSPVALTRDEISTDTDDASDWLIRGPSPGIALPSGVPGWEMY